MKNLYYIFLLLILVVIADSNAQNGAPSTRKIYWVHGLSGDAGSWSGYKDHYQNEYSSQNIQCYTPSGYSEQSGLDVAGNSVNNMMRDLSSNDPLDTIKRHIAIGHSQGGLVIRNADMKPIQNVPRQFGGFITVGTPNRGAKIINSINDKLLDKYAISMCDAISPVYQECGDFITRKLFNRFNKDDSLCFVFNSVVNFAFGGLKKPITQDYKIGGAGVTEIEAYNSTIPHVGIYGAEDSPVNWRVISSLAINTPSSLPFNETNDTAAVNWASKTRDDFMAKNLYYRGVMNERQSWAYYVPILGWTAFCLNSIVSHDFAWAGRCEKVTRGAMNWFDNSEQMWKTMTTDASKTKEIVWDWELVKMDDPYDGRTWDEWQYVPHEVEINTWDETDAIVGKNQADLKGAIKMFKSAGANHQEVRNHPSSKIIFDDLFNGKFQDVGIDFFKLKH